MKKIVITGGHHSSALPVILELKKKYPDIKIFWFGHKHSLKNDKNPTLEYLEITSLNIPFYNINAGKVYKTFSIIRLLKIPFGFFQSLILLIKIRPNIILSFGGYLAVPVVLSGFLLGIKSITHEQTVVAGYANKLISNFAKKILISWPQSKKYFPLQKVVYTGLPLREEIFTVFTNNYITDNKFPFIYITAGKSGSHKINDAVYKIVDELLDFTNIIHQCGDYSYYNDFQTLNDKYNQIEKNHKGKYFLKKFIFADEIGEVFSKSSLVISRAGAHTCFELANLEKPCILIPIPWVSHNEQYMNAGELVEIGIAELFNEDNLNSPAFLEIIKCMLNNLDKYKLKKNFVKQAGAVEDIVKEVSKLV